MGKRGPIEVSAWVTACLRNLHVNRARYIVALIPGHRAGVEARYIAEIEILARIIRQVNGIMFERELCPTLICIPGLYSA